MDTACTTRWTALGSRAVDPQPPWTKQQPCDRSTPSSGPALGLVAECRCVPLMALSICNNVRKLSY